MVEESLGRKAWPSCWKYIIKKVFEGHIKTPSTLFICLPIYLTPSLFFLPFHSLSSFNYKLLLSLLRTREVRQETDVQILFKVQTIPDPSLESIWPHSAPDGLANCE